MNEKNLKYDILKELFNISVGKAASLLSDIINRKIVLNVPDVKIIDLKDKELKLKDYFPKILEGTLMISSISFEKRLTGKANLIFPAEKMRTFINLCLNNNEADLNQEMSFTDVDFDILKEIGNIILNSIIGEVGNYLDIDLNYTLPEVNIFNRVDFTKDLENTEYSNILVLYITFIIDDTEIEGLILVNLTLRSIEELMERIGIIQENLYG